MPRGGKREGAGRPKGVHTKHQSTISKELAREALRQMVTAELAPMTEAQIKHAKGISWLVYRDKKGGKFTKVPAEGAEEILKRAELAKDEGGVIIEVWDKEPSIQAYTDLVNRALDKPTEMIQAVVTVTTKVEERIKAGRDRLAKVKNGDSQPNHA